MHKSKGMISALETEAPFQIAYSLHLMTVTDRKFKYPSNQTRLSL